MKMNKKLFQVYFIIFDNSPASVKVSHLTIGHKLPRLWKISFLLLIIVMLKRRVYSEPILGE